MRRRNAVWITGVGTASPLGNSYAAAAANLLAGKSGVRAVTAFDVSKHPSQIAGLLEPFPPPPGWDKADFDRLDYPRRLYLWCGVQALQDAGYRERRGELRIGLVLGLGSEWMRLWETDRHQGGRHVFDPQLDGEPLIAALKRDLDLCGPGAVVAAACASGNYALAHAWHWVRRGLVDVCLAGAGDLPITPIGLGCFGNLGALSRRNAEPATASRPFDRGRDGFVMGEGGALFVLESADAARRRGAHAYAEMAGFGASSDAFHMIIPSSDPKPAIAAVRAALADAGVGPDEIDYLNAHGTSTPVGDVAETRVIKTVLGEAARRVPVSSTKSMTGHLLSGAAAIDALACLVALERQVVPATINLHDPDPECDLCHVANEARPHPVRVAVSNSFGFGGSNTCIVLRKVA
jgi:3-oxoacyl-[acyl-carrier-protein] synthase II